MLTAVLGACSADGGGGDPSGPAAGGGPASGVSGGSPGASGGATIGSGGAPAVEPDAGPPALDVYFTDRVLEVELTVAPSDWDTLRGQSRSADILRGDCLAAPFATPFSYVPASLRLDGQDAGSVGIRKKGFLGSMDANKPSLKVNFEEYGGPAFQGLKDLTLNNAKQDPSLVSQCLGYSVFRAAGVPAPRCGFAHVTVNGADLGVYVNVEPIKKPLLRRHFPSDDGDLYEGTLSDFRDGWLATFDQKTNEATPTRVALQGITSALAAPDATLLAELEARLDLPGFLSFWAVEVLLEHWDGYASNTNNYYVYVEPTSGKASFLPWGTDQLFGVTDDGERREPASIFTVGALANRLWAHPEGQARFAARLREILATVWEPEGLTAEASRLETMLAPLLPSSSRPDLSAAIGVTRERILGRQAFVEAELSAARPGRPLRGDVCLRPIGTVTASFDTTWGTVGAPDPFSAGSGVLSPVVNGAPMLFRPGFVGALAGPSEDPASGKPVTLGILGLRLDGKLVILYVGLDLASVTPGTVALSLSGNPALLMEMDPAIPDDPGRMIGLIEGGTVRFERAGTTPGAPVVGTVEGPVVQTSLLDAG